MRAATLLFATSFALLLSPTLACTDNGDNGNGPGGGGTTGSAGTTGSSGTTGSAGTTGAFRAVEPCPAATDYVAGTMVDFGAGGQAVYTPSCLKLTAGATVTFNGDFSFHPISPSATRGDTSNNPITDTASGTGKTFTFLNPGFFAYFCDFHGSSDTGAGMAGVIWVQ